MLNDDEKVIVDDDPVPANTPKIKFHKEKSAKNVIRDFWKSISYAVIPFACIVLAIVVSWVGNQVFGSPTGMQPNLPIDSKIPFVSWFITFYFFCFPMCVVAYFVLARKSKARTFDITLAIIICYIISGVVYALAPTEFPLEWKYSFMPENMNFFDKWVWNTWHTGLPTCLLPSQHCLMAIACVITVVDCKCNHWYRWFMIVFNVGVVLATVFLKQHFILDFFSSLGILTITYLILRLCRFGERVEHKIFDRKKK